MRPRGKSTFWCGIGFAALTAVLWALLPFGLKRSFLFLDPLSVSWFRLTFSFSALGLWVFLHEPQSRSAIKTVPVWMIPAALLLAANYFCYAKGLHFTNPGTAQMLIQMGPLFVVLGGVLFFKERLSRTQLVGVAIALSGFATFYSEQIHLLLVSKENLEMGGLLLLAGSATWALWALLQKNAVTQGHTSRVLNLFVYGWAGFALLPFADLQTLTQLGIFEWALLVLLGLNTLVAYGSFAAAIDRAPIAIVNLVVAANPLIALLISRDHVQIMGWIGAFLVLAGIGLSVRFKE